MIDRGRFIFIGGGDKNWIYVHGVIFKVQTNKSGNDDGKKNRIGRAEISESQWREETVSDHKQIADAVAAPDHIVAEFGAGNDFVAFRMMLMFTRGAQLGTGGLAGER